MWQRNSESISNAQGYKVDKKQLWNFISNVKMVMFCLFLKKGRKFVVCSDMEMWKCNGDKMMASYESGNFIVNTNSLTSNKLYCFI